MNPDDDLRRLLADDEAEPNAAIDDRIRAAARDASAAPPPALPPPTRARRYRWAPGIGAAAAALLLAVLVTQRPPEEAMDLRAHPSTAAAPPAPSPEPARSPAMSMERLASGGVQADFAARAAPERLVCESLLQLDDITLCIRDGAVENQSPPSDCSEPLVLELESGAGPVTARRTDRGLVIRIDGTERWTVRCERGTWAWYNALSDDEGTNE